MDCCASGGTEGQAREVAGDEEIFQPVSYTQLDVYKRQVIDPVIDHHTQDSKSPDFVDEIYPLPLF